MTTVRERAIPGPESVNSPPVPDPSPDQASVFPQPMEDPPGSGSNGQQATQHAISRPASPAATNGQGQPSVLAESVGTSAASAYRELRVFAELFADVQQTRIACGHRANRCIRCMHVPKDHDGACGKDGCGCQGLFLLDPGQLKPQLDMLAATEHQLGLAMVRCYRRVIDPDVRAWQQATPGIGEHLLARLLGTVGHPRHATPYHWEGTGPGRKLIADPPFERNVAKLWAYCGHGDPDRKRRKGMTAEDGAALGNPRAKMLVHLLAEAAMKCVGSAASLAPESEDGPQPADADDGQPPTAADTIDRPAARRRSPYRDTYEQARAVYNDRTDDDGKPWIPARQNAAALRRVGKEILRDLWLAAGDHAPTDSHSRSVPGGQQSSGIHPVSAAGDQSPSDSHASPVPGGHPRSENQELHAAGDSLQAGAATAGVPSQTEGD